MARYVVEVISMQGRVRRNMEMTEGEMEMDLSAFSKGLYLLRLEQEGETRVFRILLE